MSTIQGFKVQFFQKEIHQTIDLKATDSSDAVDYINKAYPEAQIEIVNSITLDELVRDITMLLIAEAKAISEIAEQRAAHRAVSEFAARTYADWETFLLSMPTGTIIDIAKLIYSSLSFSKD